jgi:NAD(P)-dependent dehydrogenase (short-subunit alcohol dehydrogenase family)
MGRLDGKVAIVTGGASGIGEGTAERFVAEGAKVVVADVDVERGTAVAHQLGPGATFRKHDVTSESDWLRVIAATTGLFGALHVLVNNAGVVKPGTIEEATLADWRAMFAIHSEAVFLGCKHALPHMVKAGYGSIVNVSSNSAAVGYPLYMAYAAAKNSQHSLSRSIAAHCRAKGYPVRCNVILPGGIETPMVHRALRESGMLDPDSPEGKAYLATLGRPKDIAGAALFLASEDGSYVNGQCILVDGAMTRSAH